MSLLGFVKTKIQKLIHQTIGSNHIDIIGIDLGTANTLICTKEKGIVLNEASVASYIVDGENSTNYLYGNEAKKLVGKTPYRVDTINPLEDGVIADNHVAEDMIRFFLQKTIGNNIIFNPVIIGAVPINATKVERKAIQECLERSNAKEAFLIYESLASAIGAGLPVHKPCGSMIIDIGGGTTEISIISLGGIVKSRAFKYGGRKIDQCILEYMQEKYNILIGETMAETIKKNIGCAYIKPDQTVKKVKIQARNLKNSSLQEVIISQEDMVQATAEFTNMLVKNVRDILDETPPELIHDIMTNKAIICGGGANIANLDYVLKTTANLSTKVPDHPELCLINGLYKIIQDYKKYDFVLFKQY